MKRPNWPVGEHAIRPAGSPDRCFYCNAAIGSQHDPGCVIRNRTVKLRVSFEIVHALPEDWDEEMIRHHFNLGGFCAGNWPNRLKDLSERNPSGCLCLITTVKYLGEATLWDERVQATFVADLPS